MACCDFRSEEFLILFDVFDIFNYLILFRSPFTRIRPWRTDETGICPVAVVILPGVPEAPEGLALTWKKMYISYRNMYENIVLFI
jgi:hypothetical protein